MVEHESVDPKAQGKPGLEKGVMLERDATSRVVGDVEMSSWTSGIYPIRGVPVGGRCELAASREVSWPRQSVSYKTPVLRIRDERGW